MAMTIKLPPDLEKALGHYCIDTGKKKKDIIADALRRVIPAKYTQNDENKFWPFI